MEVKRLALVEEKFYIEEMEDTYVLDQFKNDLFKKLCEMTNARINIDIKGNELIVKLVMYGFVSTVAYEDIKDRILTDYPVVDIADNVIRRFRAHVESAFFLVRRRGEDSH